MVISLVFFDAGGRGSSSQQCGLGLFFQDDQECGGAEEIPGAQGRHAHGHKAGEFILFGAVQKLINHVPIEAGSPGQCCREGGYRHRDRRLSIGTRLNRLSVALTDKEIQNATGGQCTCGV